MHWDIPIEGRAQERKVAKRLHRIGKFYVFLREMRHDLFDARFEAVLAKCSYFKISCRVISIVLVSCEALVWIANP